MKGKIEFKKKNNEKYEDALKKYEYARAFHDCIEIGVKITKKKITKSLNNYECVVEHLTTQCE